VPDERYRIVWVMKCAPALRGVRESTPAATAEFNVATQVVQNKMRLDECTADCALCPLRTEAMGDPGVSADEYIVLGSLGSSLQRGPTVSVMVTVDALLCLPNGLKMWAAKSMFSTRFGNSLPQPGI